MKKIVVFAVILMLALSACGAAPSTDIKSDIIGTWMSNDKTLTLDFSVEPRVYSVYNKGGVTIKLDGETIWVESDVLLGVWENSPKNWRVTIWGDKMELKSDNGQNLVMNRLNPYPKYSGNINLTALNNGLPSNAYAYSIAIDPVTPTNIYVGLKDGGLYKSTNSGENWEAIKTGLPSKTFDVFHLAINPSTPTTLYAAVDTPAFISTDAGESWSKINGEFLTGNGTISNTYLQWPLVFDPTNPNTLYAAGKGNGINKSIDGGSHWSLIPIVISAETIFVDAIAVDPLDSNILYVGTSVRGIYKSVDGGMNWSGVNNGLTDLRYIDSLMFDPLEPTVLYVNFSISGLYKSIDGGANWSATNIGLHDTDMYTHIRDLTFDPTTPSIQYAVRGGLVLRRTNRSEDWSKILTKELSETYVSCLVIDPTNSNILYVGTTKGVFAIKLE